MNLTRRQMMLASAGAVLGTGSALAEPPRTKMGIVTPTYSIRRAADKADGKTPIDEPLPFLEYCHALGAGGVQVGIGSPDEKYIANLRQQAEANKMYLEGIVRLPRDKADVERFTTEVRVAKQAGATVLRTTCMDGRRYEVMETADAFRQFAERAWQALLLAKPIVEQEKVRLAIENHKDWRSSELVEVLKKLDSPNVGICVDTGNNLALLESPLETVKTLAPYAFTVHLKDMGVEEYADGFLLSEVVLGTGFLDLPNLIEVLQRARPDIHFNLEMITRDPLKVPCLTKKYWATLDNLPGKHLAETLALVRASASKKPLPRISGLSMAEQVKAEDENVRRCLIYAREKLGL